MRIDELRLLAFGPFTDTTLDLSGGREGFHLVYGPNEAGKSSSLRALRYLLYGIPERSLDNFIHPYAKMRIGSTIRSANGDTLGLVRRKGRSNTLRAADDSTVMAASELTRMLSGVDAQRFATMFAIGYEDLVRGGRDILQGGGNLGRLVFSAGSGIANLLEIQNELRTDAESLFLPSGKKPKINAALGRLKHSRKALRDAQLPGQEWTDHDQTMRLAIDQKAHVEAKVAAQQKELQRLQRIQEALPLISRRKELKTELTTYASAILLPETFAEKRRDVVAQLSMAEKEKLQAQNAVTSHRKAITTLEVSTKILDNSELIEEIYQGLDRQRKDTKDRFHLETICNTLRREAKETLRNLQDDLTLEEAEKLRIKKTEIVRIQELGARYERIITRIEDTREKLPELSHRIREIEEDLAALPLPIVTEELHTALTEAIAVGPLENQSQSEQVDIKSSLKTIMLTQQKLGLAEKSHEEIEALSTPSPETIRRFEDRLHAARRHRDGLDAEIEKSRSSLKNVERQIEAQRLEREVPTENDLQMARAKRDSGLRLIARQLRQEAISEEALSAYLLQTPDATTVIEAFQSDLLQSDIISDRLRREADRVAAKAALLAEQTAHNKQLQQLSKDLVAAEEEKNAIAREWLALWQPLGIAPRSPEEMGQWALDCGSLTENVKALRLRRAKVDESERHIGAHRSQLAHCLQPLSESPVDGNQSLAMLIKQAQSVIDAAESHLQKRERLAHDKTRYENEFATAKSRLKTNGLALELWQTLWEQAVRPIGLDAQALPAEATAVIEELKTLFDTLKEAGILQKRIAGIERDTEMFTGKVAGLVADIAPELTGQPAEEAALELNHRLRRSRDARSKRETIEQQVDQEQKRLRGADHEIMQVKTLLAGMCEEAGCKNYADLPGAEHRSHRRRQIEADLKTTDERLRRLSGGATVDEFISTAATVDPDGITGDIQRLDESIRNLDREKSERLKTIGSERNELSKMDGSSRAAVLAEEIQNLLGGMENDVEQYARLKIASRVLSLAIERYREKSQGPILKQASVLFNKLTGGSFRAIRAEFDSSGQPVMVGIRSGSDEIVHVEGMSDGTADQLYLALRLAGLALYLEKNEPIPFIVDDILIKFDDERAAAALGALGNISQQTQLIFFTHHRHLVELAEKHVDPAVLFRHDLIS
jgi:uncharacterized protein YhaN